MGPLISEITHEAFQVDVVQPLERRADVHDAIALAKPQAPAPKAAHPPIRLTTFHNLPLPPGGRVTGPRAMRHQLRILHYPGKRSLLEKQIKKLLLANKWRIAKRKLGDHGQPMGPDADYLQLWVRQGRKRVHLALIRPDAGDGVVIFVTRY